MPRLSEQIIPRRKALLIVSETAIFMGILLLGTSTWPLAAPGFQLFSQPVLEFLWTLVTALTVAIICQAALSYNDLYDWKVSQNRADLPNRLLHSMGYALVMLALLILVVPTLFTFPGLQQAPETWQWKLMLLLALSFLAIYGWRAGFHWFFYKWRFGEQILVLGTGAPRCAGLFRAVRPSTLAPHGIGESSTWIQFSQRRQGVTPLTTFRRH